MPEGESYPRCFGPYLRYAISTDFEYFEFFDEERISNYSFSRSFTTLDNKTTS